MSSSIRVCSPTKQTNQYCSRPGLFTEVGNHVRPLPSDRGLRLVCQRRCTLHSLGGQPDHVPPQWKILQSLRSYSSCVSHPSKQSTSECVQREVRGSPFRVFGLLPTYCSQCLARILRSIRKSRLRGRREGRRSRLWAGQALHSRS